MLPGFRFLLAAILLSMSILVFGLGAAALLRAAHEEFAGNPAWHGTPETTFAQQREAARPVLAMLRVETPLVEKPAIEKPVAEKPSEDIPAAAAAAEPTGQVAPPALATTVSTPAAYAMIAALAPQESPLPTPAKSEISVAQRPAPPESPQQSVATPAPAAAPASLDQTGIAAPKIAALRETAAPANEAAAAAEVAAAASEPAVAAALPDADTTATNIAAPEGLPLTIDVLPRARPTIATPDASIIKKRLQARRAAQRRRIAAARARLAQQALLLQQQQQALNPFFRTAVQPTTQRAIR